ncbi:MAG: hypothetical protein ABIQ53_14790 [Terracoccus sp.]
MLVNRPLRAVATAFAIAVCAVCAACTSAESPLVTASASATAPSPSMTTIGATDGPAPSPPASGAPFGDLDVGLTVPRTSSTELARSVIGDSGTEWNSFDPSRTKRPARLVATVRCVGVGGPVGASIVVTKGPFVGPAPDGRNVLARREVECDGKAANLDVGAAPQGDVGIDLVEPADQALRGYALLVRS